MAERPNPDTTLCGAGGCTNTNPPVTHEERVKCFYDGSPCQRVTDPIAAAAFPFVEVCGVEWCYVHHAEYVAGNRECGAADEYPCMTIPLFYRAGDS